MDLDFDSCRIDFSDLDGGCLSSSTTAAAVVVHQNELLPWPPIFQQHQNNSWVTDFQSEEDYHQLPQPQKPQNLPFISRGDFSCYHSFMEACKREETIEELLDQQKIFKKEILDLHRQNYSLENDKEKLINELINFGIRDNSEFDQNDEETQTVESTTKEDDAKNALIEELEAKLAEAEERFSKAEKENAERSEKIFEVEIEKQRLNIKLHHYIQVNKSLEENNDKLEKEIQKLKAENQKLSGKLENLEQKIERIEEGDFEHVSCDDSVVQAAILI